MAPNRTRFPSDVRNEQCPSSISSIYEMFGVSPPLRLGAYLNNVDFLEVSPPTCSSRLLGTSIFYLANPQPTQEMVNEVGDALDKEESSQLLTSHN